MSQLATQASNSTFSQSDRNSMQQEVEQRLSEINRIASQTQYNGLNLLDGSLGNATFQVGADAGQLVNVSLSTSVKTSQIGQTSSTSFTMSSTANLSTGSFNIQLGNGQTFAIGNAVAGGGPGQQADSAFSAASAINGADITGLSVSATNSQNATVSTTAITAATSLTINGTAIASFTTGQTTSTSAILADVNNATAQTGVSASINADGSLDLIAADGSNIVVTQTGGPLLTNAAGTSLSGASGTAATLFGTVSLSSSSQISVSGNDASNLASSANNLTQSGLAENSTVALTGTPTKSPASITINGTTITTGANWNAASLAAQINAAGISGVTATADSSGFLQLESQNGAGLAISSSTAFIAGAFPTTATPNQIFTASLSGSLSDVNVSTVAGAQNTLQVVAAALNQVDAVQGELGAVQDRFTSTITQLQAATQNTQSSQSNIQDANFAAEASQLSRAQVLQQAGTAMVAQANQLPQEALKLIPGA
ncbi:MAG: flagellin [Pararobbsia sp.]